MVAAGGGEEEEMLREAHTIFAGDVEDEKDEISVVAVNKINEETRKYELDTNSKQARAECVSYYAGFNTNDQRTQQRVIQNYDREFVRDDKEPTTTRVTGRARDKYGMLRYALKSDCKIRTIGDWMFDYVFVYVDFLGLC